MGLVTVFEILSTLSDAHPRPLTSSVDSILCLEDGGDFIFLVPVVVEIVVMIVFEV